ncbi:transcriptional regulator [Paraoerskovia sediminicola]|uniref:Transcriptional regulator n=1 Tax=Paraoerskovia sediminicola TaxID=1138587 RepID=A0ABN6X9C7_9CELL|nr:ROK family transcriptional regulator [Paraoerskovia sediminicola]BDZ41346.1 transcriptional regulator [Paraoerskovia sediminicola]
MITHQGDEDVREDPVGSRPPSAVGGATNRSAAARQGSLREHNLALALRAILGADSPPSRAWVARATGLTRPTVSTLVDQLVRAGLIAELAPLPSQGAGRPAVPLSAAPRSVVGLGLEVNVDYIGGRVLDLTGDVVAEAVLPGEFHDASPAAVLGRLGNLARDLLASVRQEGMVPVGARLALPGLVDLRERRLRVAPNLGWSGLDPVPLLGLPDDLDVQIANEANLAGVAQLSKGGPTSFLYVSGEVGIGAAIVLDGELYLGRHGWSGEIGHVAVDPAGPRCRCGAHGCLEQYSGKDALCTAVGLPVTASAADLLDRLTREDTAARAAAARAGTALGQAVAATVNLFDVDTVLLGGLYADLADLLLPHVRAELDARVLATPWSPVDVRRAPVASHAALSGAARLALQGVLDDPGAYVTP